LATALVAWLVQWVGDVGPIAGATVAVLRGEWLLGPGVFPACAPSLAVGSVAMIAAMLLRPVLRR
ncbi:MAG: hypothetical protein WAT39_04610, partial [Planctomycetota bacterium]